MRVLIVSAFLACAVAAPAPQFLPIAYAGYPILTVAPTIPPGNIQAAVIDAQVKINDQAQYIADQARHLSEIAAENANEGVAEANDLAKEQAEEAKWAAEERKWQELSASQTAQAKIAEPVESEDAPAESEAQPEPAVKSMSDSSPAEEKNEETPAENPQPEVKSPEVEKVEEVNEKVEVKAAEILKPEVAQPINLLPAPLGLVSGYPGYQPLVSPLAYSRPLWGSYPYSPVQYLPNQFYTQLH